MAVTVDLQSFCSFLLFTFRWHFVLRLKFKDVNLHANNSTFYSYFARIAVEIVVNCWIVRTAPFIGQCFFFFWFQTRIFSKYGTSEKNSQKFSIYSPHAVSTNMSHSIVTNYSQAEFQAFTMHERQFVLKTRIENKRNLWPAKTVHSVF